MGSFQSYGQKVKLSSQTAEENLFKVAHYSQGVDMKIFRNNV